MLEAIKSFFEQNISLDVSHSSNEEKLRLATAALLIEMMHQDEEVHADEIITIKQSLTSRFNLSEKESHELFELAHAEAKDSTDYYQFTSLINQHYSRDEKIQVIEHLWEVAYSDRHLDTYEEHMVRRISELLYVPHSDFIQAKHRVMKRNKIEF